MSKTNRKLRTCPVVNREITSAECGEHRISRYLCPETCPFNPFSPAQYDVFSEIEALVIRKGQDWYVESAPDRAETLRKLDRIVGKDRVRQHAFEVSEFYFQRDAAGRTCAERWEAAGFPGLKNDERVVQRAMLGLRPRLVEVHRVLDGLRVEAVDLLEQEPKPFLICDRSLAASACRFSTFLGWHFPLPHYWRTFGLAIAMPSVGPFDSLETATEIIRHLGGPAQRDAWPDWFANNLVKFSEALTAVSLARRAHMFAGTDMEFGKAVYELRAPFAACRDVLDGISVVSPDQLADGEKNEGFAEARVWLDPTAEFVPGGETAQPVLGRVLLGQAFWRLEAMGAERLTRLRRNFEGAFGEQVRFTGERRDDIAAHLKSKEPNYDRALVPPRLLESPTKFLVASSRVPINRAVESPGDVEAHWAREQDRAWLDQAVPGLDNKTPREAAADPELRPKLIRLLKERVLNCDERNLERGTSLDVNWLLEDLGATEILFPPPPRAPARSAVPVDEPGSGAVLEPWPLLPEHPFTHQEAVERLMLALTEFENLDDAALAMQEAGGFLLEDVRAVIGDMLNDAEHTFLEGFIEQVWFAFVPPGCYGPDVTVPELQAEFRLQLDSLARLPEGSFEKESARFVIEAGPQPAISTALAVQLVEQWKKILPRHGAAPENRTLMLIILKAIIELLDKKCRESAL